MDSDKQTNLSRIKDKISELSKQHAMGLIDTNTYFDRLDSMRADMLGTYDDSKKQETKTSNAFFLTGLFSN